MPWLFKAEPNKRLVNGVDVSFSADRFAEVRESPWEGVRNYQARNLLRDEIKTGHDVLFYHSSTKVPGVAALATVIRDGYPDYTAWDKKHPYYDAKSDPENPRWYMVDVRFQKKLSRLVALPLLHYIASGLSYAERKDVPYLTDDHIEAIADMPLLRRSRLSVQPVSQTAYEAIVLLGEKGGFDKWPGKWNQDLSNETAPAAQPAAQKAESETQPSSATSAINNDMQGPKRKRTRHT
ncbi:hypothetical protein MCUN1_001579 [Malassezia cuniculi]|uniref:EVE domain-containing protein n=1 Tax=Malassezia cuniculi TaxID=948313 RepID=A0AAF0EQX0_9BASI|nr:hypothetical protein MCUN1_001579 [Malassezia cuniculi]